MLHSTRARSARLARHLAFLFAWLASLPLAAAQFTVEADALVTVSSNPNAGILALAPNSSGGFHAAVVEWIDPPSSPPVIYEPHLAFLAKLDAQGNVIWSRSSSATTPSTVVVATDPFGNSAIGGGAGAIDSYAADGTLRFSSVVPSCSSLLLDGLLMTSTGATVVAYISGGTTITVAALGPTGNLLYSTPVAVVPSPILFRVISMREDGSVAGITGSNVFLVQPDGTVAWNVPHGVYSAKGVASGPAGEVAVVGSDFSSAAQVSVLESTGALRWTRTVLSANPQRWGAADFDPWGGVVAVGVDIRGTPDASNGLAASYASDGTLRWLRAFAGPAGFRDVLDFVVVDRTGDVHAAGYSEVSWGPPQELRLLTVSWSREGTQQWARVDSGPDHEQCTSLVESSNGAIAAGGVSFDNTILPQSIYTVPVGGTLLSVRANVRSVCFGDGLAVACPCGNTSVGGAREGCRNSSGRGARASATGTPSVSADTLRLRVEGTTASAPCLFFQGTASVASTAFGDGLRCAGGQQVRLYVKTAQPDTALAPLAGDPAVSTRSAAGGDVLAPGMTRTYQVAYRDTDPLFCAAPAGAFLNASSALVVVWEP